MKCLRCGYCCTALHVVIVVDPAKGIRDDNLRAINLLTERCPHLRGNEPGKFRCAVHDEPWYKETPCYSHTQIEWGNQECRMGRYVLDRTKKRPRGERDIISAFEAEVPGANPGEGAKEYKSPWPNGKATAF